MDDLELKNYCLIYIFIYNGVWYLSFLEFFSWICHKGKIVFHHLDPIDILPCDILDGHYNKQVEHLEAREAFYYKEMLRSLFEYKMLHIFYIIWTFMQRKTQLFLLKLSDEIMQIKV